MSDNWIKMRTNISRLPEVYQIAKETGLDRFAVVGRLHELWSWLDMVSEDGNVAGVTFETVDDVVCNNGFAQAMQNAGWLDVENGILIAPSFAKHNGQTAKKRANTARRVAVHRGKTRSEPGKKTAAPCNALAVTSELPREEKEKDTREINLSCVAAPLNRTRDPIPSREQLAQMVIPTTDELTADARGQFLRQINQPWDAVVDYIASKNSGAERFTPESWATAYIERAALRNLTVYHPNNRGNRLSPNNWTFDFNGFMEDRMARQDFRGLVLRNAPDASRRGPIPEPKGWQSWPCFDHYKDWHWSEIPDDVRRAELRKRSELLPS